MKKIISMFFSIFTTAKKRKVDKRVYNHKVDYLPEKTAEIEFLTGNEGSDDVGAVVIGGLSILGDTGYISPVVTILLNHPKKTAGWCLCLGYPEAPKEPYYFDVKEKTHKGLELPNCMTFFEAKIDPAMAEPNADQKRIDAIMNYVLPHISDAGPPPPHPKDVAIAAANA